MPASTQEIFNSLKKNGFNMSLSELEKILPILVNEGFIQRNAVGVRVNKDEMSLKSGMRTRYRRELPFAICCHKEGV